MMLIERSLHFPSAVLCTAPGGVFFAYGLEVEGNAEAGLARVRATGADGRPLPFSIVVDLRELPRIRRICRGPGSTGLFPVSGGTSVAGTDAEGCSMLRVQTVLQVERSSMGELVLAPGPEIPWAIGIHPERVDGFLAALEDCIAGATLAAVA